MILIKNRTLLWIAFKCVSLQEEKQRIKCDYRRCWVVNCFQMCIFARGKTTRLITWTVITWLWIAFKCVSLQEEKQLEFLRVNTWISCELLSNVYLCKRKNNDASDENALVTVVNCFQMCIFARGKTTKTPSFPSAIRLWIAFKCVSLQEEKQRTLLTRCPFFCCELLSNVYLCKRKNNSIYNNTLWNKLWIAFKCVSLQEEKQLNAKTLYEMICCELLSNVYLCKRKNNQIEGNNSQT